MFAYCFSEAVRLLVEVMLLICRHGTMLRHTVKHLRHLEGAEWHTCPSTTLCLNKATAPQVQPGKSSMRLPLWWPVNHRKSSARQTYLTGLGWRTHHSHWASSKRLRHLLKTWIKDLHVALHYVMLTCSKSRSMPVELSISVRQFKLQE